MLILMTIIPALLRSMRASTTSVECRWWGWKCHDTAQFCALSLVGLCSLPTSTKAFSCWRGRKVFKIQHLRMYLFSRNVSETEQNNVRARLFHHSSISCSFSSHFSCLSPSAGVSKILYKVLNSGKGSRARLSFLGSLAEATTHPNTTHTLDESANKSTSINHTDDFSSVTLRCWFSW